MIAKLTAAVQTATDFEELAALLGLETEVTAGIAASGFSYDFPLLFFNSVKEARFSIVVKVTGELSGGFSYDFPLTFGNLVFDKVKCFFNKLKPANCQVIFIEA